MSLDPLIGASVAAAATERIEVGIGILQVPLRHPVELAQRVLTAQLLCEGRLLLGVGSGSTRGDFEAVQQNFDDRMALLENGLATMQRLWDGETVEGVHLAPSDAVKGGPPVLIGSWAGPRWIGAAAREFDGWIASRLLLRVRHAQQRASNATGRPGASAPSLRTYRSISRRQRHRWRTRTTRSICGAPPRKRPRGCGSWRDAGFDDAVVVHRGHRRGRPRGHPRAPPLTANRSPPAAQVRVAYAPGDGALRCAGIIREGGPMADDHAHDHDHDHTEPPSEVELRVKALESLLVEKGLADSEAIDTLIDAYENKVGPSNGKRVVARERGPTPTSSAGCSRTRRRPSPRWGMSARRPSNCA